METTFGKTVETRFIPLGSQALAENACNLFRLNSLTSPQVSAHLNSLNTGSTKINHAKRQQQLQHIYLSSYNECNAPSANINTIRENASFLRPSIQVPSSAVLTRKKFKHLANASVNSGYSSDGDYCNADNFIGRTTTANARPLHEFHAKKPLSSLENNGNSLEQELRKCLSTRSNYNVAQGGEHDLKLMRYKSIERQHAKYAHEHKRFQERNKLEQNKVDSYRYQYLSERLNEQSGLKNYGDLNSRVTHLLSPKMPPRPHGSENENSYNEKIQNLLNKQKQRQRLEADGSLYSEVNTSANLLNYLTWKNCQNIYPPPVSTKIIANEANPNKQLETSRPVQEKAISHRTKSISTPNTPQLCTLPR